MSASAVGLGAALLMGLAVLVWPRRLPPSVLGPRVRRSAAPGSSPGAGHEGPSLWHQDPVELYRRWRLRRRPGELVDDVLDLLRGIGPALEAGLTPSRAIELAATTTLGAERVRLSREAPRRRSGGRSGEASPPSRPRRLRPGRRAGRRADGPGGAVRQGAHIDRLVGALLDASDRAVPASPVWTDWAERSASAELAFVAAAWRLSETTGAPLASAVDRAVRGLLDARARRGKVAVAVAGPRATVSVLTLLPLTGPLFGLACGIDPGTLYFGSSIATVSVTLGLGLVWAGRTWCTRMVRAAVRS